jgi:hypothetical protein
LGVLSEGYRTKTAHFSTEANQSRQSQMKQLRLKKSKVNESQNIQLSKEGTNLIQTELTTLKRIK